MIWGRYAARTVGPKRTRPPSGCSSPIRIFSSVDFPVPLSPMSAMRSPPSTSRFRSQNSRRSPKDFSRSLMCITSSPENSRSPKRWVMALALEGFSVWRMRSIRRSMEKARLWSLSAPMKAQR